MGTNNNPTDTKTIEGVNFSFEQDNFVILIVWQEGTQRTTQTLKLDLSDDELQQLEMVAFSERQARFFRDMRNFQPTQEAKRPYIPELETMSQDDSIPEHIRIQRAVSEYWQGDK